MFLKEEAHRRKKKKSLYYTFYVGNTLTVKKIQCDFSDREQVLAKKKKKKKKTLSQIKKRTCLNKGEKVEEQRNSFEDQPFFFKRETVKSVWLCVCNNHTLEGNRNSPHGINY